MSNQYLGDDRIVHESIDVSKASSRRIYSNSEAPDDIVTRLRDEAQTFWDVRRFRPLWIEAADEIERLRKELRDLQIAYAKDTDELEKELTVTKFQLAYWREIALENQTNG